MKKMLFADLDGTLIKTKVGGVFPKGVWDMEIRFEVLDAIKALSPSVLMIVTNQGGIESGMVDRKAFVKKMNYLKVAFEEYLQIPCLWQYCTSIDKDFPYRKPNVGMLDYSIKQAEKELGIVCTDKNDCVMIGDASGKVGDFSDSDKRTADNFGIEYIDVEDFVKMFCNQTHSN